MTKKTDEAAAPEEVAAEQPTASAVAMLEQIPTNLRDLLGEEGMQAIEALDRVQTLANEVGTVMRNSEAGPIVRTMVRAVGVKQLAKLLTDDILEEYIMPLMNQSQIGFETDRAPGSKVFREDGAYTLEDVRQFTIAATLNGFPVSGGESMLLAGKWYPRKEGYEARLREWPGFTDFEWNPIVSLRKSEDQPFVKVEVKASWKLDGKPMSLHRGFIVRSNKGMLYDAIVGKAKRKTCAAIYERLTGSALPDPDDDVTEKDVTPKEEGFGTGTINVEDFRTAETVGEAPDQEAKPAEAAAPAPQDAGNGLITEKERDHLFALGEGLGLTRMDVVSFALNVAAEHGSKIDRVADLPRGLVLKVRDALEYVAKNDKTKKRPEG